MSANQLSGLTSFRLFQDRAPPNSRGAWCRFTKESGRRCHFLFLANQRGTPHFRKRKKHRSARGDCGGGGGLGDAARDSICVSAIVSPERAVTQIDHQARGRTIIAPCCATDVVWIGSSYRCSRGVQVVVHDGLEDGLHPSNLAWGASDWRVDRIDYLSRPTHSTSGKFCVARTIERDDSPRAIKRVRRSTYVLCL